MSVIGKIIKNEKLNIGDLASVGLNIGFGIADYKENRQQGKSKGMAVAGAVGEFAIGEMLGGGAMFAINALQAVPQLATSAATGLSQMSRQQARSRDGASMPVYNATFNDTQQAYTMRQAGMQLAENSKYNLQQSLMGNEAAMLHM